MLYMEFIVLPVVCDPPRKMKQPQSSNDNKTTGADGENHLDVSLEEEEVSDLSPKKSLEIGDGSTCKLDEGPCRVPEKVGIL